jgi:hypothetical protein
MSLETILAVVEDIRPFQFAVGANIDNMGYNKRQAALTIDERSVGWLTRCSSVSPIVFFVDSCMM